MIDRSALGRRSRNKGKKFELVARDHMLEAWISRPTTASLVIRRSSQAERAYEADLIIEGPPQVPRFLVDLWVECQHANMPDPASKLAQAKRDAGLASVRTHRVRTPVVVWRRTGERSLWLSTEYHYLCELLGHGQAESYASSAELLVTCPLGIFLDLVGRRL